MKIDTFHADTALALSAQLSERSYDFVSIHANADVSLEGLGNSALPAALHGATSCHGAMTQEGLTEGLAAFAIEDPDGAYGTGISAFENTPRQSGKEAAQRALDAARQDGRRPDMVWIASTPGFEEEVLLGVEDALGTGVPIIGGSAADNDVSGNWRVFDGQSTEQAGVIVSVLYPSTRVSYAYQNGFNPTASKGTVTRAEGRRIYEIDHRPASTVYSHWTQGAVSVSQSGGGQTNILADSCSWPLGREVARMGGQPAYLLAHPAIAQEDGGLDMFSTIPEGEELTQMAGEPTAILEKVSRVAHVARLSGQMNAETTAGALVIFCGGCRMMLGEEIPKVVNAVGKTLNPAPFLGAFTFGEQGAMLGAGNRHGNLMISCIVFGTS